jgi:hypothetical protein
MKITLLGTAGSEVTGFRVPGSIERRQRDGGLRPVSGRAEAGELQSPADDERARTYMEDARRMTVHLIMSTPEYQLE